ncbi:MAG: DNA-3-methyladenine glycosylase [Acidobacteria bacterium]|nr:DNA-3-methyladenine glycosylase [Acidobacteriota bacterium]
MRLQTGNQISKLVRNPGGQVDPREQSHQVPASQFAPLRRSPATPILARDFYARPAVEVAPDLLGCILVHGPRAARIVEAEAYPGLSDPASHAYRGLTPRTRVLFGPPGHAYVYLIYGMHECLNFVTQPDGEPGCVLIRALEPLRGVKLPTHGPGRLTRAMAITRHHYGADLTRGRLRVHYGERAEPIAAGPRIGIGLYPDLPLRFWLHGNPFVSRG